jgi:hypothetical protein
MAKSYDVDKIRRRYEESLIQHQAERYPYERNWFRNCIYLKGIQWVLYDEANRLWRPRKVAKWVPTPVTNKFTSVATSIIQVLSQREPSISARAATDKPDDIAAAMIAQKALPVILKEAGSKQARQLAAAWLTLTGTAILHPCYDNDPLYGTTFVSNSMCPQGHGVFLPEEVSVNDPCPTCGAPCVEAVDSNTGEPIGEELPKGRVKLEVFSPFECFFDLEGHPADELPEIIVRRRYPIDVIRRKFDKPELEADNSSNTHGSVGINLLRAIAYASTGVPYGSGMNSGKTSSKDDYITIDSQWIRPCTDFPEGLVSFWANNQLLNEDEAKKGIPYRNREGKPLWPWHVIKFDEVPGQTLGRTPLDDVAPKQDQRNKLEALIELIVIRMSSPHWLVPKNMGVTEITGIPGQTIEYNQMFDRQGKPEIIAGQGPPTSLMSWLEKIDQDINEVAGVFEVLKGSAPSGVTAGTALRLLLERALTRFTPVSDRYEEGWQNACSDLLSIFQQYGVYERIYKIAGEGDTWEIKKFTNADINAEIDIIVESGSSLPKSAVGEQAMITDLASMGVINPQMPETQYKILERFGSTDLLGTIDSSIRYAQRENWDLEHENKIPEIDVLVDDHVVHIQQHKEKARKSEFQEWPPELKQKLLYHILEHQQTMMPAAPMPMGQAGPGQKSGAGMPGQPPASNKQQNDIPPMPGGAM